jgi:hypothetical protein
MSNGLELRIAIVGYRNNLGRRGGVSRRGLRRAWGASDVCIRVVLASRPLI